MVLWMDQPRAINSSGWTQHGRLGYTLLDKLLTGSFSRCNAWCVDKLGSICWPTLNNAHLSPSESPDASMRISHKRTVPSAEPDAKIVDSRLIDVDQTIPVWPLHTAIFLLVARSHNITSLSSPADAANRPRGLIDTVCTGAICPVNMRTQLPVLTSQQRKHLSLDPVIM